MNTKCIVIIQHFSAVLIYFRNDYSDNQLAFKYDKLH